jgi:hypothetical protein
MTTTKPTLRFKNLRYKHSSFKRSAQVLNKCAVLIAIIFSVSLMTACGGSSSSTTTGAGGVNNDPFDPEFIPNGTNNPTKPIQAATD